MPERNDARYAEDAAVALAIYCDENGLTNAEGLALAEQVAEVLISTVEDRPDA